MDFKNNIIMINMKDKMEPHCSIGYIENDLCTIITKKSIGLYNVFKENGFYNLFRYDETQNLLEDAIYGFEMKPLSPKEGYIYIKVIKDNMQDKSWMNVIEEIVNVPISTGRNKIRLATVKAYELENTNQ